MDIFEDFRIIKDLKFDIIELQKSLKEVLKIHNYYYRHYF